MKLFFSLVLTISLAVLGARLTRPLLLGFSSRYSTSLHNRKRLAEFQKFENQILDAETSPSFIFGASSVEGFMDSRILDQKFAKHQIVANFYNMGFPILTYFELSILATDLHEKFLHRNKKADMSFIRLEPALLTKTFSRNFVGQKNKFDFERLINLPTANLFQQVFNSGENLMYGTGGQDDFSFWLSNVFVSCRDQNSNIHYAPWIFKQFQEQPEWNYQKRGNTDFNKAQNSELFESIMKKKASSKLENFAWLEMTRRFGSNDFDFDEKLVGEAIEDIHIISKFSNKTIVFYYPDRGSEMHLTEKGQKNLQLLFERIQAQASVQLLLIDAQKLATNDYYDPTHLSPSGWDKASDLLVEAELNSGKK